MRLTKISLAALVLGGSVLLSACGGGNDSPLRPVSTVTTPSITTAVTADTVKAIVGSEFTFASGVDALNTTASTTLTLSGTDPLKPLFTLKSGGFEASGEIEYGSCFFKITSSNFLPATTFPFLQVGQKKEVTPCDVKVLTSGLTTGGSSPSSMTFVLGGKESNSSPITVTISSTGVVTVNGVTLGTATYTVTTGAGG